MELRQLEHFLAVAEECHFTRAAKRMHVAQSGLSASIRALELELGAPLFLRTTRQVELTQAGRALLPEARKALGSVEGGNQTLELDQVALERLTTMQTNVGFAEWDGVRIGIIDTGRVIALDTPEGLKRRIDQKEIIRLELTGWHEDLAGRLKSVAGIDQLSTRRQGEADLWEVHLHARNSRAALPGIVEQISGNGTRLVNMNIVKPSLEDVFIHLTGKALRD